MSTNHLEIDPALFDDAPTPPVPSAIEPDDIDIALASVPVDDATQARLRAAAVAAGVSERLTVTARGVEHHIPAGTIAPLPLAEVLPVDFPLPLLTRFVPNPALKAALDLAVREAGAVVVEGPAGLQAADTASATLRAAMKEIETHFDEPVSLANSLHKRLTGLRGEWVRPGLDASVELGRRMATERTRLERIAADERRRQQEEANRLAREEALARAKAAEAAQAPAQVVEQMKAQAETIQAAPVPVAPVVPTLAHTTVTKTWKARVKGTPADADPTPSMAELSLAQQAEILTLVRAIAEGKAPLSLLEINWSAIQARARAEKSTLAIPGIEPYEESSTRAKAGRRV